MGEYRKCIVRIRKVTHDTSRSDEVIEEKPALFYGVFQKAYPYKALLVYEASGQVSKPVAVVEIDRSLREVDLSQVKFLDGGGADG
jgi:hypothetical protein